MDESATDSHNADGGWSHPVFLSHRLSTLTLLVLCQDICRVCRSESTHDRPLFYPCVCTGSIKYIHQDCLLQWLKYSKKEYCELCHHKFNFAPSRPRPIAVLITRAPLKALSVPVYHPDMPKRLPVFDLLSGMFKTIFKALKFWLHSTLVAISWLGVVPLTASRIYRCLFTGSVSSLLTLPLDMLSTENIVGDIFQGGKI
jgi:E3 ubiquitin-protein ligase MARCH6